MTSRLDEPRVRGSRRAFPLIEGVLVATGLAVLTWFVTAKYYQGEVDDIRFGYQYFAQASMEERDPLEARYGPQRFSRGAEEWIIRDFFQDRRDGVFLDVGANHYRDQNNTYYLESTLGWSGIAVEAQASFGPEYLTHRPRTKFVAMFASDTMGESVTLFVPADNPLVASSSHELTVREGSPGQPVQVPTTTLTHALDQAGIPRIDFLSMDIELAEPAALAGFDIDRFQPALVCIEAHPDVRQQILDYFADHRYVVVGKYLRADMTNLYFTPRRPITGG